MVDLDLSDFHGPVVAPLDVFPASESTVSLYAMIEYMNRKLVEAFAPSIEKKTYQQIEDDVRKRLAGPSRG